MFRHFLGLLAVACLPALGCASEAPFAASDTSEASEKNPILAENAQRTTGRELASVEVEGATISFIALEVDGQRIISVQETASAYAKNSPIEPLMTQGLTHLEIFKALAPDRAAPAELIEAHSQEAAAAGRTDTVAVKQVAFEPVKVEKSAAACSSFIFVPPPNYNDVSVRTGVDDQSGTYALPLNYNWYFETTQGVVTGGCNDSASTLTLHIGWYNRFDSSNSWHDFIDRLPGNSMRRWWFDPINRKDPKNPSNSAGSSWGITGENGAYYHLRIGVWGYSLR